MSLTVANHFGGAKVYRIALIGCTGAGKTCLLAALGAVSGPHVTARRLHALPDAARPAPGDEGVEAFVQGEETLARAETELRAGRQPAATDPSRPPLLAVYELTVPGRGQLTVEVADYSGELLNSRATNETGRRTLAAICHDCDAVVVLADAPQTGASGASHAHMSAVRACFSEWVTRARGGAKVPIPVALVFTMFDRRVRPGATADERTAALANLIEGNEYCELVRGLRNVCDVFQEFAASAFGGRVPPTAGSVGDRPLNFPNSAFGLQPPFVWACGEADKRKATELREQCDSYRWLVPGWRGGFKLAARARALAPRMHDGTEEKRTTQKVAVRAQWKGVSRAVVSLFIFVLALALFDAAFGSSPRRDRDTVQSPSASDTDYDTAVTRLGDYAGSSWFRHRLSKWVVLTEREAHEHVSRAETAREQRQWDAAQQATDRTVKYELLRAFVTRYHNGSHASDAGRLIKEEEQRRADEAASAARKKREDAHNELLARLEDQYTATLKQVENDLTTESNLVAVQTRLRALRPQSPLPDTRERIEYRGTLDKQITDKRSALTKDETERARLKAEQELRTKWVKDCADILDKWNALNLKGAAEDVEKMKATYATLPDYKAYRDKFAADVVAHVSAKAEQAKGKQDIGELKNTIKKLDAALGCAEFKTLVPDQSSNSKLSERRAELVTAHDKILYAELKRDLTEAKAETFLRDALTDTMKDAVRTFLVQLKAHRTPHKVKVHLEVGWGNWVDGTTNEITLWRGDPADENRILAWGNITAKTGTGTHLVTNGDTEVVPNEPFRFTVVVTRNRFTFLNDTINVEAKVTDNAPPASVLREKQVYDLKLTGGNKDPKANLLVSVEGLPPVPVLPDWKDR